MTLMTLDLPLPAQCSLKSWATGSGCDQNHHVQKSSLIFTGLTDTDLQFYVAWYLFIQNKYSNRGFQSANTWHAVRPGTQALSWY